MSSVAVQDNVTELPQKSPYRPETALTVKDAHNVFVAMPLLETLYKNAAWLKEAHSDNISMLSSFGLPGPKLERFKYTNIMPQVKKITARYSPAELTIEGAKEYITPLADILVNADEAMKDLVTDVPKNWTRYEDTSLIYMAHAFVNDGYYIRIPKGQSVDLPIELLIKLTKDGICAPRLIIELEQSAELTLIERHEGQAGAWNNAYTQIRLGANAKLKHYRIQQYGSEILYTQNTHVSMERDSSYEAFTLVLGAGVSRNQIHTELKGENIECHLNGINLLKGSQHADSTFTMEHQAPHGHSNQFVRSVLDDQSRCVYQGKVHVFKPAQKTDAYQLSNTLLLSEGAEMDTKPELEIYADDVSCSHGTTTGQLDEDPMFYLRSRGIGADEARALLITAFIGEVLEKITCEEFYEECEDRVEQWLKQQV